MATRKPAPKRNKKTQSAESAPPVSRSLTLLQWAVALALPWAIAAGIITWVVGAWYPSWTYDRPTFPPDPFGWTAEQRRELALVAVDYLQRRDSAENSIHLLRDQRIPGTEQPLYNEREIDHMLDVKHLTDAIRTGGLFLGILVIGGLTLFFARRHSEPLAWLALWRGGLFTLAIVAAIGLFMLLAWDSFFVRFHELLFPPDTWTFNYSDSLIRLFPEKFWMDIGMIIVGGTLLGGGLAAIIGRWMRRRQDVLPS
jgi:integral membrane protein (TIGR01906 family)